MSVSDYVTFEKGNPLTDSIAGEWFQTTDLFGYFEKFRVRQDGTIWLTPTKVVPCQQTKRGVDAHEMVKIESPEVQILIHCVVSLIGEDKQVFVEFRNGKVTFTRVRYDPSDAFGRVGG